MGARIFALWGNIRDVVCALDNPDFASLHGARLEFVQTRAASCLGGVTKRASTGRTPFLHARRCSRCSSTRVQLCRRPRACLPAPGT